MDMNYLTFKNIFKNVFPEKSFHCRYHQCVVAWWNLFKPSHPSILNPHVWLATYRKWGNIFVPQVKTSKNILLPTEVLLQNIFVPPQVKPSNYFCPKSNIGHLQEMGEYFLPQIKTSKISSYLLKVSSRASNLLLSPKMPYQKKTIFLYATTRSRNLHPIFAKAVTTFVDA